MKTNDANVNKTDVINNDLIDSYIRMINNYPRLIVLPVTLYGFLGTALSSSSGECFLVADATHAKATTNRTHNAAPATVRLRTDIVVRDPRRVR